MNLLDKLTILSDAAKYDAACTSSGAKRGYQEGKIGCTSTSVAGCCHTFSSDGRCVTLLKVLLSNDCCYNCKYCVNRCTNDTPRATFTPEELAELTIEFYRRNYIEGLFLSSAVLRRPSQTRYFYTYKLPRFIQSCWGTAPVYHNPAVLFHRFLHGRGPGRIGWWQRGERCCDHPGTL